MNIKQYLVVALGSTSLMHGGNAGGNSPVPKPTPSQLTKSAPSQPPLAELLNTAEVLHRAARDLTEALHYNHTEALATAAKLLAADGKANTMMAIQQVDTLMASHIQKNQKGARRLGSVGTT